MSEERMICPECGKKFLDEPCYENWPEFSCLDNHYFSEHMPGNYSCTEIEKAGGTYEHYHLSMLGINPCASQSVKRN